MGLALKAALHFALWSTWMWCMIAIDGSDTSAFFSSASLAIYQAGVTLERSLKYFFHFADVTYLILVTGCSISSRLYPSHNYPVYLLW